jgi:hypothetical protein
MSGNLTAANAIFQLSIPAVFQSPQQLQGFSADDIFDTDSQEAIQAIMGVDGFLSAGFTYVETKQSITLQADSASGAIFDAWRDAEKAALNAFPASATIILPAISRKWTMVRGFLTGYKPIPGAGKVLKPRTFGITWNSNGGAPYNAS